MPLYEVETTAHIMIANGSDEDDAQNLARKHFPTEEIIRVSHRARDIWVISKSMLGIEGPADVCTKARDCLSHAAGDKLHAMRLYMKETGCDLDQARKAIESTMSAGW